jgi:CMP-N,N'-diacetyllegionaminic acid synthase
VIGSRTVVAVIAARGGSKGLPRKNVRLLAGKPLVAWPVAAAKSSRLVDRVIVSSDDDEILGAARAAGADVPFRRPAELSGDTSTSTDVVRHAIAELNRIGEVYQYLVLLEPTSPLTEAADIDGAIEQLDANRGHADSIVGVCRAEAAHPEFAIRRDAAGLIQPFALRHFGELKRRQDVEDLYFLDGSLYVSDVGALLSGKSFYHDRTMGYVFPRWKSFEVDSMLDFFCIEAVLAHRDELRRAE